MSLRSAPINARVAVLGVLSLCAVAFALVTWLEPSFQQWEGVSARRADGGSIISVALGDSRRLFAKHIYAKADAYFHRGYYPSIYDQRPDADDMHMAAQEGHQEHETNHLGKPRDWIDAFSRHFYPSRHSHMGETDECCGHDHEGPCSHGTSEERPGSEREMLPWFRLAASLDPERPETYVVAAYWLRSSLGRVTEAEQFLREGLRNNPGHPGLLFELGRIFLENRGDTNRARNVWELALKNWDSSETAEENRDALLYMQLLGQLAKLEYEHGNYSQAIVYLKRLIQVSPSKDALQKWIEEAEAKAAKAP